MTSTADALWLCKYWLQRCLTSHVSCQPHFTSFLPTRLIDISDVKPKLWISRNIGENISYATLSHCWGSLEFTILRESNLDKFRSVIPSEALPKTFQDAIYVARYLGFQYLWIDSLCIMQDSDSDWIRESGLMADIYGGATLNIAASSANDASEGCFFYRHKSWRCRISAGVECFYDCVASRSLSPFEVPLHRRAWVVQERYLSCRTLHFYKDQIFWECETNSKCETFPKGYPRIDGSSFDISKKPLDKTMWPKIIFHYSRGRLSKASDKLVAIGGLARLIQAHDNDEYTAGLWKSALEKQLYWCVFDGGERIKPYQAPTWSWASVNGKIQAWEDSSEKLLAERLHTEATNVQVQLASADPFGAIKTASLQLKCTILYKGTIEYSEDADEKVCLGSAEFEISVNLDCEGLADGGACGDSDENLGKETIEKDSGSEVYGEVLHNIYFLPLLTQYFEDSTEMYGLLLEQTEKKEGQYYRIGSFWTSSSDSIDFLSSIDCGLEISRYISTFDSNGNISYTIELI